MSLQVPTPCWFTAIQAEKSVQKPAFRRVMSPISCMRASSAPTEWCSTLWASGQKADSREPPEEAEVPTLYVHQGTVWYGNRRRPASTLGQNFGSKLNESSGKHFGKGGLETSPILKSNEIKVGGPPAQRRLGIHATKLGRSKPEGRQQRLGGRFQACLPRNYCLKLLEPSP